MIEKAPVLTNKEISDVLYKTDCKLHGLDPNGNVHANMEVLMPDYPIPIGDDSLAAGMADHKNLREFNRAISQQTVDNCHQYYLEQFVKWLEENSYVGQICSMYPDFLLVPPEHFKSLLQQAGEK